MWLGLLAVVGFVALFFVVRKAQTETAPTPATDIGPSEINPLDNQAELPATISVNTTPGLPRGERNNNPGNVMYNPPDQWQGLVGHDDAGYCIFSEPYWGIRAIAVLIHRYYRDYHLNTVRLIIGRYAPPPVNPTDAYVAHVCALMGVGPDQYINVESDATMLSLIKGIINQENGRISYSTEEIQYGISLS